MATIAPPTTVQPPPARRRRTAVALAVAAAVATAVTIVASRTGEDFWTVNPEVGSEWNLTLGRIVLFLLVFGATAALPPLVRRANRVGAAVFVLWALYLTAWLVATWPGVLMPDTVDVVVFTRDAIVHDFFGVLWAVLNVAMLDLVPHAAVWGPVHVALGAGVMAYASQLVHARRAALPPVVVMNVVALLSVAVVVNMLMYSRDSVFAMLHVVLALWVAHTVSTRTLPTGPQAALMAGLVAVLSVLRGDGIVLVVVVPLLLLTLRPPRRAVLAGAGMLLVALLVFRVLLPSLPDVDRRAQVYEFALRLNPLSRVLQTPFKSADPERDLRELGRVIDVAKARELHTPVEMAIFYSPHWNRAASPADFAAFGATADRMLRDNPTTVLASRVETFGHATGVAPEAWSITFHEPVTLPLPTRLERLAAQSVFIGGDMTGLTAEPPVQRAYTALSRVVAPTVRYDGLRPSGTALHWNFLPALLLLAGTLLFWRRVPFAAAFALVIVSRVPLVFLAAPSAQFKYYFSVHLGGIVLLGILLAHVRREHVERLVPRALAGRRATAA